MNETLSKRRTRTHIVRIYFISRNNSALVFVYQIKMTLGTFKRCCVYVDLRTGSFIIAYLLLIERLLTLTMSSIHLSGVNTMLSRLHHLMHSDIEVTKLILSLDILLLTFELLITFALINGLHKRIQEQVQMFYVGGSVFFVMRVTMAIAVTMRYAHFMVKKYGDVEWLLVALEVFGSLLYIYFLSVIRSFYFRMREEEAHKQWSVFSTSTVQLKIDKEEQ